MSEGVRSVAPEVMGNPVLQPINCHDEESDSLCGSTGSHGLTDSAVSNIINTNVPTIIVTTSESKINGGGIVVDVSTFDDSPRTPNQITSFESAGEYNINNLLDDMNSVVSLTGNSMEESGGSDYASMIKKIGLDQKQEDDNNSSVLIDSN